MRVQYVGLPPHVRKEVKAIIQKYKHTAPSWLQRLVVQYMHDHTGEAGEGAIAYIETKYEYRYAVLTILGQRWSDPLVERERVIVHELCHTHIAPISDFAFSLLEQREEESDAAYDPVLGALIEQWRVSMEASVEDTAQALMAACNGRQG